MFDNIPIISDIWASIPDTIIGLPKCAFFGLLIGIFVACYEGIFTKFKDYRLDIKHRDEVIVFSKKYLMSGIVAIIVTFLTVLAVTEANLLGATATFGMAFAIGLAEGGQTIKYLNKRIDLYIKKCAIKVGTSEEQAEKIADAVEFVEIEEPKDPKKPISVSFEEL